MMPDDPVAIYLIAAVLLIIAIRLNPVRFWKDRADIANSKASIAGSNLSKATYETDVRDLPKDTSVNIRQTLNLEREKMRIGVEGQVAAAQGLSKVHIGELKAEHGAVLNARKNTDAYEREQERRRGRTKTRERQDSVQAANGQVAGTAPAPATPSRDDRKAASRHRKPASSDPPSRADKT